MRGFQSGDCIKAKLEKSKNMRKEQQCKCKTGKVCTCKGNKYPDLNVHEKEIMEILEIKDIDVDELKVCTQWLKSLKKLEESDSKVSSDMIQPDIQSWLLDKVICRFITLISKICNLIFLNLFTFSPVFTNDKN